MSIVEEFRRDEERVLDRLVDGELGQHERRELLAALDDEPSGWRRCALAFLESQTWRWQLTRLKADATLAKSGRQGAVETRPLVQRGSFWGICLAVAASLMVAFGLGTRFSGSPATTSPAIATSSPTAPAEPQVASASPDGEPGLSEPGEDPDTVTLALTGEDEDPIELPVALASEDDSRWLEESEPSLPAALLDQLRAAGMEVVRRQRLFPVDLSDGRRLVVPVEQVDIRRNPLMEEL